VPAKYMHGFVPKSYGNSAAYVFAWSNDPSEDADLLDYVAATAIGRPPYVWEVRDSYVDRSGPSPVLHWDMWYLSGGTWHFDASRSFTLSTSSVVYFSNGSNRGEVVVFDPAGFWDSDQYGRPFDLNDLLA
jgi:hypothetical protein